MSNLDYDIAMAQKLGYGVFYGRYKADHPGEPVEKEPEPEPEPELPVQEAGADAECPICGKAFRRWNRQHRYCSGECLEESRRRYSAERYRKKMPPIVPRMCPICQTEFLPKHRGRKYCGKECKNESERLRRLQKIQEETI